MSKKTGYLLGILLTIIIGVILNWWLCCGPQADASARMDDNRENQTPAVQAVSNEAFALNDPDSDFAFNSNENFNFNRSDFTILKPISVEVDKGIELLKSLLSADGSAAKFVNITGYFHEQEENNSAYADLGLARANAVKEYFVSKGISSAQISTFGDLNDALVPYGDIYRGPVSFVIGTKGSEDASKKLNETLKRIQENPLVFYFETAQTTIILHPDQLQKMADLRYYLENVDAATILVAGHADITGSVDGNMTLGQNRALATKEYLVSNSIPESRIAITSEGAGNPAATNSTKEGRAKNRRTVVTIN